MALTDVISMAFARCWNIQILPYPETGRVDPVLRVA